MRSRSSSGEFAVTYASDPANDLFVTGAQTPTFEIRQATAAAADDLLVARLRAGEEAAFELLIRLYAPAMIRFVQIQVGSAAVAEEVVQDTWLRVLRGIDGFEGRSSLRTWIFVILGNCTKRRAEREARSIPFASLEPDGVDVQRFFPDDHPRWARMWSTLVSNWDALPAEVLESVEVRDKLAEAVEALPPNYATVFTLRDIEGWDGPEVCALLTISAENQRVILHRARARIRAAMEEYLDRGTS